MRSMDDRRGEFKRIAKRQTIGELLITRERPEKAFQCCNSMAETMHTNQVALYMGVDDDDPRRSEYVELAAAFPFARLVDIPGRESFPGLSWLWNQVADVAHKDGCDILHLLGDDIRFVTPGWDEIVLREFALAELDGFLLLFGPDGNHEGDCMETATHIWINASYMDAVGEYAVSGFMVDAVDTWQYEVYRALGRTRYNADLRLDHLQWRRGRSEPDHVTTDRMQWTERKKAVRKMWSDRAAERKADVKKVARYIERVRP